MDVPYQNCQFMTAWMGLFNHSKNMGYNFIRDINITSKYGRKIKQSLSLATNSTVCIK